MGITAAIIQARMGSTRLPGKIMKKLCGKTVLEHVINRVASLEEMDEVVIATTTNTGDDPVVELCNALGVKVFRGSENDVLSRYGAAAAWVGAETIIRITSDCPLIDPAVMRDMLVAFRTGQYDFVTNSGPDLQRRTFPRGLDTEIFSFKWLARADELADSSYQREHVTPYLYAHCGQIYHHLNETDCSDHRWTLDTAEDYELIKRIYDEIYPGNPFFGMKEVLALFQMHPELKDINAHIIQKSH